MSETETIIIYAQNQKEALSNTRHKGFKPIKARLQELRDFAGTKHNVRVYVVEVKK